MRSAFDFAPYRRSTVGFDRLFDMLENSSFGQGQQENYPPFDLIKLGDNDYRIELAVAGFKRHQIEITIEDNQLNIRGRQEDDKSRQFIHRGIATRQFSRTFVLADGIEVKSADLSDGLLCIDLVRREPERSVRRIEISKPQV